MPRPGPIPKQGLSPRITTGTENPIAPEYQTPSWLTNRAGFPSRQQVSNGQENQSVVSRFRPGPTSQSIAPGVYRTSAPVVFWLDHPCRECLARPSVTLALCSAFENTTTYSPDGRGTSVPGQARSSEACRAVWRGGQASSGGRGR
jgi:hypothetical protein